MSITDLICALFETEADLNQPVFVPDGLVLVEITKVEVLEGGVVVLS